MPSKSNLALQPTSNGMWFQSLHAESILHFYIFQAPIGLHAPPLSFYYKQWSVMRVLVLLLLPSYRQARRHCCQCHPHHCHPHAIFLFAKTSRLGLLISSCWLCHSLAGNCFCLAEICRLATLFKTRCSTVINLHKLVHTLRHVRHSNPATTNW